MIPRGWGVLNGTQTQEVARRRGIQHFAKGSGVSHSQLRKIASHALADPAKSFADMFHQEHQGKRTSSAKRNGRSWQECVNSLW